MKENLTIMHDLDFKVFRHIGLIDVHTGISYHVEIKYLPAISGIPGRLTWHRFRLRRNIGNTIVNIMNLIDKTEYDIKDFEFKIRLRQ